MLLGLQLSATELSVVAGHFELAPDQLARYRHAVDNETTGNNLQKRVAALAKQGLPLASFSQLTHPPRGFANDRLQSQYRPGLPRAAQHCPGVRCSCHGGLFDRVRIGVLLCCPFTAINTGRSPWQSWPTKTKASPKAPGLPPPPHRQRKPQPRQRPPKPEPRPPPRSNASQVQLHGSLTER